MSAKSLTPAMRELLWKLVRSRNGLTVRRAEVTTARRLEKIGVVMLEDDGYMRCNSERWTASITDLEYAQALLEMPNEPCTGSIRESETDS